MPLPDDNIYNEPDVPPIGPRMRIVIDSTPAGRTVRWRSLPTVAMPAPTSEPHEASHRSTVAREARDVGHPHVICNIETRMASDHDAATTTATAPASDTNMEMENTLIDDPESSFPSSTLCFPKILVINGLGDEIEKEVSDDEQPALAETSQDRHRRERANVAEPPCLTQIKRTCHLWLAVHLSWTKPGSPLSGLRPSITPISRGTDIIHIDP